MKYAKYAIILCALAGIAGCAAIFGRSTDDPAVKLQWASEHFAQRDEPVEAEQLILDAIQIYQKRGDRLGRAEAYRQYGLFLRSNAVRKFEKHYREEGFLDKSIQFTNRYQKAVEYFTKAREIFAEYNKHDLLSSTDISLAKTYAALNRNAEACVSLTKSLENYNIYKKANPDMKEFHAEEVADYEEYVGILKKQLECREEPPVVEPKEEKKEEKKPVPSHSEGSPI